MVLVSGPRCIFTLSRSTNPRPALRAEGIFRIAGRSAEIARIREAFDQHDASVLNDKVPKQTK
jgi:hypothetical protein